MNHPETAAEIADAMLHTPPGEWAPGWEYRTAEASMLRHLQDTYVSAHSDDKHPPRFPGPASLVEVLLRAAEQEAADDFWSTVHFGDPP